ncbi:MAG TPA: choice-of-anchor A family protein, partial [Sediminibacterium sp.]|nr:choice-of-anchor A family protein [Sediminibacterium sp.]
CPFILYNFYNTETLKIEGNNTIEGTVFAPLADIVKKKNSANIEGQIIGLSFEQYAGENHYAPFSPDLSKVGYCSKPVVAVINGDSSVCRSASISLTNSTTNGTWASSNSAVATVNASGQVSGVTAGIASISYAVTNSCGTTTVTKDITVNIPPTVVAITGSNTVCLALTATLSNTTAAGVWSSSNTAIATVTGGVVVGESLGTANIIYTVTTGCGTASNSFSITVQDCGSVSSGGTGGLESQSLGDAVAKRLYQSALNGTMQQPAYESMKPWVTSNIQRRIAGTLSTVTVNSLVPMQLTNTRLKSYLTTPTDIIGITNAKEVVSVDYTLNGSCKGVVFATTTKAAIYDHTKAVCDRLKGAQVVKMDSVLVNGLALLRFGLKYEDGHTENIISFSASINPARNTIAIQSNWLKAAYIPEETMYNFQIWSVSDELSTEISSKILTQLQQIASLELLKKSNLLPDTYFVSAKREGT